MSDIIVSRLSAVRGKYTLVSAATGAAMACAFVLAWSIVAMCVDWEWVDGLPWWARMVSLLLELAGVGYILYIHVIRPMTRAPDDEEVALMIERQWPDFKTRLIAAVQFTQPEAAEKIQGSRTLVKAMVGQAEKMADETQVTDVVATRTLNRSLGTAAGICLVAIALFLYGFPTSSILLGRMFLGDAKLPTKTHIESFSGDLRVAIGDPLKITTVISGYHPAAGKIQITYASGRYQELPMDRDPNTANTYDITLDSVLEKFTYVVRIYDGHSNPSTVDALERPAIAKVDIQQIFPPYTGLGTVARRTDDLTLLAGSKLKLTVTSTKPLGVGAIGSPKSNYVLRFVDEKTGHSDTVPLIRSQRNVSQASLEAPMSLPAGLNALSIHLVDSDDLESKDAAVYPVEIVPDRSPTVRIAVPQEKEVLVTAQATLEIDYVAEDDILLGKVALRYKVGEGDAASATEGTVESIALPLPANTRTQNGAYLWDIGKIPVPAGKPSLEGSVIEFWIEDEDTNNISGPGKGASEHFAARVVTREEKLAQMAGKTGEAVNQLNDDNTDQTNAANHIADKINGPAKKPAPLPKP